MNQVVGHGPSALVVGKIGKEQFAVRNSLSETAG